MLFSVMSGGSPYLRAFSWAMLAGEPNPACSAKPSALTLGIMFEEKRVAAASAFLVGVGVMGLCGCNCSCLDVCEPIFGNIINFDFCGFMREIHWVLSHTFCAKQCVFAEPFQ